MNNKTFIVCFLKILPLCVIFACAGNEPQPLASETAAAGEPTSVFEDVTISGQDSDGTVWRVFAREGSAWERESTGKLVDVAAELEKGGRLVSLKSGSAEADQGEVFRFYDRVEFTWGDYRGKVEEASYLQGKGIVKSEQPAALEGPGLKLSGEKVEIDVDGKIARLWGNVHAVFGKSVK